MLVQIFMDTLLHVVQFPLFNWPYVWSKKELPHVTYLCYPGEEIRNLSYNAQRRWKLCVWHHLQFIKVTRWEDKLIPLACPYLEKDIGELCSG